MSFSGCIKNVGKSIDSDDVANIKAKAAELIEDGMPADRAYKKASKMSIKGLLDERSLNQTEIEKLGGSVSLRSDPKGFEDTEQLDPDVYDVTEFSRGETADAISSTLELISPDNNIDVRIIHSLDQEAEIGDYSEGRRAHITLPKKQGDKVVIHLLHDKMNEKQAIVSLLHEARGHYAVDKIVGRENWDKIGGLVDEIRKSDNKTFNNIWSEVESRYGKKPYKIKVMEFFAIASERRSKETKFNSFMRKIRELFLGGLRTAIPNVNFKMTDVDILLSRADDTLKTGKVKKSSQDKKLKSGAVIPTAEPSGKVSLSDEGDLTKEQQEAIEHGGMTKRSKPQKVKAFVEKVKHRTVTKARQGIVDQYASFKDVLTDERTWMMAHLTAADKGATEALIEGGQLYMKDNVIITDVDKKSLNEILEPLGKDLDRWMQWMAGNRAELLAKRGKENLFEPKHIEALKTLNQGREEKFDQVRKDFEEMNDSVVQLGVSTGLINAEEAKMWKEEGFYLPFYRVLGEDITVRGPRTIGADAGLVRQKAYKELKGSKLKIDDLLSNAVLNWNHIISASLKNQTGAAAMKSAEELGIAKKVTKKTKGKDALFVRENGAEVWYELQGEDADLITDSLLALNYNGMNGTAMKTMRAFKKALTLGVTVSPEFKVRNLIRDSIQAIAVTDMDTNIAKNLSQGWAATDRKGKLHYQMLSTGATFGDTGYIYGADPDAIRRVVDKGVSKDTILDTTKKTKSVFDKYQDFGARLENVNRAANFVQALNKGDGVLEAAFKSRDHLDFSRTGTFPAVRAIAQAVPFFNARLQGLDKLGRAAMDSKQRAQFLAVTGAYSAASVLLYLSMKDDEDYKAAEQWERDSYHLFKLPGSDIMYRIPRPFEVGAIASMAERAAEQAIDDEVHGLLFAERLGHSLFETFNFNPTPAAVKPMLEVGMNKNWFTGRPIESVFAKGSSKERKKAWTSQTAIGASSMMDKVLWDKVVLSPVQIDHLVQGYFGWAGGMTVQAIDTLIARPLLDTPIAPSKKVTELPMIKAFVSKDGEKASSRYATEFYERLNEIEVAYADIRNAKQLGEIDKMEKLKEEHSDKLLFRKKFSAAKQRLSEINRAMVKVRADRDYTAKEKRAELDRLLGFKNRITKKMDEYKF